MQVPRVCIAAAKSGSGKTLITCGLLELLKKHKYNVGAFKCGPDFIDPMFHSKVLGIQTTNLDTFFTDTDMTNDLLLEHGMGKDICVLEGVMGFYDGIGAVTTKASTYEVARITKTPAILVIDMQGMSLSAAALVKGFCEFQKDHTISGILLNRISAMLYPRMKEMLEMYTSLPVIGYLPKIEDIQLQSRHLGLLMPDEIADFKEKIKKIADIMETTIDLNGLFQIAERAEEIVFKKDNRMEKKKQKADLVHLAVAKDEAFCFIYEDNIRYLEKMGAKITYFSPIRDKELPKDTHGLILYGGYPELYAKQLSENVTMKASVLKAIKETRIPVIAECGGFLYLTKTLTDEDAVTYPMTGLLPAVSWKEKRLKRFGYITLTGEAFGCKLKNIKAHEFHYYETDENGTSFTAQKAYGDRDWECIHANERSMIGFPHCYYYGNPDLPNSFLKACKTYRKSLEE